MSVFKCKMCGGTIEFNPGDTVGVCDSCGTKQTLPRLDDDRRANLYDRANHFRRNNDFDKAMGIYEQILNEDSSDAEAYWSLVLCRYGIEYVEDPATHKRLPTVNRAQYTSVFADEDYKSALRCADAAQRVLYEQEAHAIDEIQKGILEISSREEPFDVFICYKETDQNGRRTPDSVLANDLYHQLTQEGFKVFFSRITLEDKLGTAYEPYIFAALNSAKVMVVLGTRPEYFNAVWVKNEWSRYLSLIKNGAKKVLIPAYRDMDPYDLPDEFSHLQAQDMSKLGFMQDLIRGIKKLAAAEAPKPAAPQTEPSVPQAGSAPLLKRAFMFLEDGEWSEADAYCEKVLDLEPECARAYLGKLMAELRVRTQAALRDCAEPFDGNGNYKKALRFADDALAGELRGCIRYINERNENARLEGIYSSAVQEMQRAATQQAFLAAAGKFDTIPGYQDAKALAETCRQKAEESRKDAIYSNGKAFAAQGQNETYALRTRINAYNTAIGELAKIPGWRDADELAAACKKSLEELEAQDKAEREEKERKLAAVAAEEARAAKQRKKAALLLLAGVAVVIAILLVVFQVIVPSVRYRSAEKLLAAGDYTGAAEAFEALGDYKDAKEQSKNAEEQSFPIRYTQAEALLNAGDYDGAAVAFGALQNYKDAEQQVLAIRYTQAETLLNAGDYDSAMAAFKKLGSYKDAKEQVCYMRAEALLETKDYTGAIEAFEALGDYKDAKERIAAVHDVLAQALGKAAKAYGIIGAGGDHTVGLKADGTVVAAGSNDNGQCDASGWTNIIAISAGGLHTVGLKADGTVVATGSNSFHQCDVSDWTDIVAISAGYSHTVGLKADGTVVAVSNNMSGKCNVSGWTDVVAVSTGSAHTVGLKADGTVVAIGTNDDGRCDVRGWTDIIAISAGLAHTVGLKADGTVVAVGRNRYGQCDVGGWTDIVAISAGDRHTVGLKADGTVVAAGWNSFGQCEISDWTDIVAISARGSHTVGLKADGTVVAVGDNGDGECNVSGWTGIKLPG